MPGEPGLVCDTHSLKESYYPVHVTCKHLQTGLGDTSMSVRPVCGLDEALLTGVHVVLTCPREKNVALF